MTDIKQKQILQPPTTHACFFPYKDSGALRVPPLQTPTLPNSTSVVRIEKNREWNARASRNDVLQPPRFAAAAVNAPQSANA